MAFPLPTNPTEPEVVHLARVFREALSSDLDAQVYSMAEKWTQVESVLSGKIDGLLLEIDDMQQKGMVTDNAIRSLARYQSLRDQTYAEIKKYNGVAEKLIGDKQFEYAKRGIDDASNLITASYAGKVGAYFNRLPVSAAETMAGYLGDGSPLSRLLNESFPLAWKQTTDALFEGISLGLGPRQVARNMVDGLGYGLNKATVIARTEILRSYRQSSVDQYRESKVVTGFYRLVYKPTACIACLMSDGEYFEVESDFDDHVLGKCSCLPRVRGADIPQWEKGMDWFKGLDEEKQSSIMGAQYYDAYKNGMFDLADLRTTTHSDVWGDSPAVASLTSLLGAE